MTWELSLHRMMIYIGKFYGRSKNLSVPVCIYSMLLMFVLCLRLNNGMSSLSDSALSISNLSSFLSFVSFLNIDFSCFWKLILTSKRTFFLLIFAFWNNTSFANNVSYLSSLISTAETRYTSLSLLNIVVIGFSNRFKLIIISRYNIYFKRNAKHSCFNTLPWTPSLPLVSGGC